MAELVDNQAKCDAIRTNFEAFCGLCDVSLLDVLNERVSDLSSEWQRIEERLRRKVASLKVAKLALHLLVVWSTLLR